MAAEAPSNEPKYVHKKCEHGKQKYFCKDCGGGKVTVNMVKYDIIVLIVVLQIVNTVNKNTIVKNAVEKVTVNIIGIRKIVQYAKGAWYVHMVNGNEHALNAKDHQYVRMVPEKVYV